LFASFVGVGNLLDKDVGETLIADYILFTMNKNKNFRYVEFFQLDEPTDCVTTLLGKGAINRNLKLKIRSLDGSKWKLIILACYIKLMNSINI